MGKLLYDFHKRPLITDVSRSAFCARLAWEEGLLLPVSSRLEM